MDTSFKKKPLNKTHTKQKQPTAKPKSQAGGISRQSFRQIQQQFNKSRHNHQKVLQSLERMNAASIERRNSRRVETQEAGNSLISAIEYFSNTASQIKDHSLEKSTFSNQGDMVFHGHYKSELAAPDKGFKERVNMTMQHSMEIESLSEENTSLKGRISQIQAHYKAKIYDHEVYIKELTRENGDLQDAWARSRQLLQQLRSEKQAAERQALKDKEEYAMLREILLKENQYYKGEIRILQREANQLREKLHKMAGLKSGDASAMEQIEQTDQTEESLLAKVMQLQQIIKGYCFSIPKTTQYQSQIARLLKTITQKNLEITQNNQEIAEKNKQLAAINSQKLKLTKQFEVKEKQLQQTIEEKEVELKSMHDKREIEINQKIEQVNQQNQAVMAQNVQRQFLLSSELSKRLMQVSALSGQVEERDQRIGQLQTLVAQISELNNIEKSKNVQSELTIKDLQSQLNKMKSKQSELVDRHVKQLKIVRQLSNEEVQKTKQQINAILQQLTQKDLLVEELQKNVNKPIQKRPSIEIGFQTNKMQVKESSISTEPQEIRAQVTKTVQVICQDSETSCKPQVSQNSVNTEEHIVDQLEKCQQQIASLRKEKQSCTQQLQKCKEKLLEAHLSLQNAQNQANVIQGKSQQLLKSFEQESTVKHQRQQKSKEQIKELLNKIQEMQDEYAKIQYQKNSLKQKYEEIADEYQHFRTEFDALTQNNQTLEQKIKLLEQQIDEKDQHIEEITHQLTDAHEKYQELTEGSKKECEDCRRLQRELNRTTAQLRSTQYGYEDKLLKIEDQNESLKEAVTRIRALSREAL